MSPRKSTPSLIDPNAEREPFRSLWTNYLLRLDFLNTICSSTPSDPEVIKAWLAAREPKVKPAGARSIEEINEEVLASLERGEGEPDQTFSQLVFQRHKGQLVMRASTLRSHYKESARVLSNQFISKIKGERAYSTRVINGVYYDPKEYWIPLMRDGEPVPLSELKERDKAVHARGPHGEALNALKRFEYIDAPVTLTCTLKVLGPSVSETDLRYLFEYGGVHGYAGERGDGEGRYTFTLDRIEDAEAATERTAVAVG